MKSMQEQWATALFTSVHEFIQIRQFVWKRHWEHDLIDNEAL